MKGFKKVLLALVCVILIACLVGGVVLVVSGNTRYFEGEAEAYYQELLAMGFPEDYARPLTELHLLHPEWNFTPLLVTEGNPLYRWDYIIEQETKDADLNLISSDFDYRAYRHPTNRETYDSGYYQASKNAVEYFMDPRNFLNETDIFQFYDLSSPHGVEIEGVEAVLVGTFMEDATLENEKSYAEYFLEVGQELGVNPIYLAVKARQEQGVGGTSPILSGECGSLLAEYYANGTQETESGRKVLAPTEGYASEDLLTLDGYYNLFNIKASGNGLFAIYHNAMKRATEGTEHMADAWGSPSWNTLWKSLYGGAYTIKTSFIDRYQNTIYLQKFNVDSHSGRNFWGQYMQNVAGSLTESRTLFGALASSGVLDENCNFIIPVYAGMPNKLCADPAKGDCSYLAVATEKYTSTVFFSNPVLQASNETLYDTISVYSNDSLHLRGIATHSYGVRRVEYRWDDGEWQPLCDGGTFDTELPISYEAGTSHILTLRTIAEYDHENSFKKSNYAVLSAVFYINVVERPKINISVKHRENTTTTLHRAGTDFTLPVCEEKNFVGWYGSDDTLLPSGGVITPEEDVSYTALYMRFETMRGAALVFPNDETHLRFYAAAEIETLEKLTKSNATISFFATVVDEDGTQTSTPVTLGGIDNSFDTAWRVLSADTQSLNSDTYNTSYSMHFWAICTYSDGSVQASAPDGIYCQRSAADVASAALADTTVQYDNDILEHLKEILSATTA
jgi:beta-N-acetylglucosaminidase